MATTDVVDADHEEPVGVDWLARTDEIIPPAEIGGIVGIDASNVVRSVESVAYQHRVASRGIEGAISFVGELVRVKPRAAF